jgi:hypothetical protein
MVNTGRWLTYGLIGLILAGCGGVVTSSAGASATPAVPPDTGNASSPAAPALEGVWQTPPVTQDDVRIMLRATGNARWIDPFLSRGGWGHASVFTLRIGEGEWTQTWSSDGGPAQTNDEGSYVIGGDTVTVTHDEGKVTFGWSVSGDELTLTWIGGTIPPTSGIPDEIYERAFFSTVPYRRQS